MSIKQVGWALAAIFLLALAVKSLSFKPAFRFGLVFFFGSDAWCHMRRMHYAADHHFRLPEPDPLLNFPEGTYTYWGPLFDYLGAAVIKASGARQKLEREKVVAWIPAVLGALCVIPAFLGRLLWRGTSGGFLAVALCLFIQLCFSIFSAWCVQAVFREIRAKIGAAFVMALLVASFISCGIGWYKLTKGSRYPSL